MTEKGGGLHILDALDNLNALVDATSLEDIEVTGDSLLIPHKEKRKGRGYAWVQAGPDDQTVGVIKETFHAVNLYLQDFYDKMKRSGDTKRLVEGINTIMVLVGEATKNLERFDSLFKKRVNEFEDYKQLQNFYRNKVIKESFHEFAKLPIPKEKTKTLEEILPAGKEEDFDEWAGEEEIEEVSGVHILNDVDVIKRDHLYELFYLKNEAGNNFFTYDLARNLKQACNFEEFAEEYFGDDPLLQIKNWEDKTLQQLAGTLLKNCNRLIAKFYKEAMQYKEMEVISLLHNALMALMMASNPRNLIRQFSLKGCHLYFHDFLRFLRETLLNREYQKFLIYSPPPGKTLFQDLMELVHALCYQIYTESPQNEELRKALAQIVERDQKKERGSLSARIEQANIALTEVLKKHPNGPLFKAVDIISEDEWHIFDPLYQGNLPAKEWNIVWDGHEIAALRIPCPTLQEIIDKAYISEEFKTFLRSLDPKEHLLFVNFQDRTSWKEHARSLAIEELARHAEFAQGFTVVTLAKDTDFYNQAGLYEEFDEASLFIDHFNQHLQDEITGYYFPPQLKKLLFPHFVSELLDQIHTTFFTGKAQLTLIERLDFIELAYHFIELKLMEIVKPTFIAFSSKDALDIGGTSSMGAIALLTISHGKKWNEEEFERLLALLFGPTLMNRERVVHPERLERVITMIRLMESRGNYLNEFAHLYEEETLNYDIRLE